MTKPVIGVLPLWDENKKSVWMLPGYMQGILQAGGIPVILPFTRDKAIIRRLARLYDGFLFTGGQDVSPGLYGEEPLPQCGETCAVRDFLEKELFCQVLSLDKPVFGICRGIQAINAFLGGSLYQDLPSQYAATPVINHQQTPPYAIPRHTVSLEHPALAKLAGSDEIKVNSYHHQAIRQLAKELAPAAFSPDGLVEAAYMLDQRFIWAVQWHPEYALEQAFSGNLFRMFVDACN